MNDQLKSIGPPVAGDIYSFRTRPLSEFSPPETGRYAAFKIIAVNERLFAVAVLEGVYSEPPSIAMVRRAGILQKRRFAHVAHMAFGGREAAFGVNIDWTSSGLDALCFLGNATPSAQEAALGAKIVGFGVGCSYSTLDAASSEAEGEWRSGRDRNAFLLELKKIEAKFAAERTARQQRYQTRLRNLTWEKFLAETAFERWSQSPPFPPPEFTAAARERVQQASRDLQALGPKPLKRKVRAILRDCVQWFNDADKAAGEVIETEEREDICAVLEEMAFLAKQKGLVDEIDGWREW